MTTGIQWLTDMAIANTELEIAEKERELADIQRTADFSATLMMCCLDDLSSCDDARDTCREDGRPNAQCDAEYTACSVAIFSPCDHPGPLLVNSEARIDSLLTGLRRAELTALRAELSARLAMGRLTSLWDQADRLIAQQEEAEQLLINLEAARNDPNIRIYRNTAILDADRSFEYALVDAYRATRVFEYYTAQCYAPLQELFLARMVSRGEHNLENYVIDLQRELRDFEESFGLPAMRVAEVSLRDDIFGIPETDQAGRALSQRERMDLFREELTDVSYLDQRGYTTIPFATTLDMTSPLTAIHKILRVEAEIIGSDVGDRVGRIYLTQRGTGSVRGLDDLETFYRFPPLTAVVNPFFNGVRIFDPEVYQDQRLRDRPLANTLWELGINQRDEEVNRDINLDSLTDVRLYIYYTDFTVLEW